MQVWGTSDIMQQGKVQNWQAVDTTWILSEFVLFFLSLDPDFVSGSGVLSGYGWRTEGWTRSSGTWHTRWPGRGWTGSSGGDGADRPVENGADHWAEVEPGIQAVVGTEEQISLEKRWIELPVKRHTGPSGRGLTRLQVRWQARLTLDRRPKLGIGGSKKAQ